MKNRHLLYTLSLLLLCCMLGCILNGCKQTNSFIVSNTEGSETMEEYRLFLDEYSGLKRPDCRGSSTIVPQQ